MDVELQPKVLMTFGLNDLRLDQLPQFECYHWAWFDEAKSRRAVVAGPDLINGSLVWWDGAGRHVGIQGLPVAWIPYARRLLGYE